MEKSLFSDHLQKRIDLLKERRKPVSLGSVSFDSPLLLAPMSAICNAPFRLLMQELGAGGTVSELISCHGINHGNQKTRDMLKIDPRETNIGIQLFGEDPESMARAAMTAEEFRPKFIDINMGCPVRKVVTKGGGSALMKEEKKLGRFFATMKKSMTVPLTVKIRTGWDVDNRNAPAIVKIAREEGLEFVAIHGRTRTQQYKGQADWQYIEELAREKITPLIGNGDLHSVQSTRERMQSTNCDALMLGRGPLRNPFLFLESYLAEGEESPFCASDVWEILKVLDELQMTHRDDQRVRLVQMRKFAVWFASGYPNASQFRQKIFQITDANDVMPFIQDYFLSLGNSRRMIDWTKSFMAGGHG